MYAEALNENNKTNVALGFLNQVRRDGHAGIFQIFPKKIPVKKSTLKEDWNCPLRVIVGLIWSGREVHIL